MSKNIQHKVAGVADYYRAKIAECKNDKTKRTDFIRLSNLIMNDGQYILGIIDPDGNIVGFNVTQACLALNRNPNSKLDYRETQSIISRSLGSKFREFNIPFGSRKANGERYYGIVFFKEDQIEVRGASRVRTRGHLKVLMLNETNREIKEVGSELQLLLTFDEEESSKEIAS